MRQPGSRTLPLIVLLCYAVLGCNQQTLRPGGVDTVARPPEPIPEDLLLDVGIDILDPGLDHIDSESATTTPGVRRAEAEYISYSLAGTLQKTGQWGAVRVIPARQSDTDVYVAGEILKSDGETLEVRINVSDTSGRDWFTRTYTEQVNQFAYDPSSRQTPEPFQRLYDHVADDMQQYMRRSSFDELKELRTIGAMRFAQRFAPDAFSDYLEVDNRGHYRLRRLPAQNDPILQRIEGIRQRDYMFVDTLQEFYASFATQMKPAYDQWRRESYTETHAHRKLKSEATARKIGGVLAVIAGILAQTSGNQSARTAGVAGIAGGAYLFKTGLDKSDEAKIHAEALKELAGSLSAEIAPQQIVLADRTVTLTGTVQEQYQQWREILRDMYIAETGQRPSAGLSD